MTPMHLPTARMPKRPTGVRVWLIVAVAVLLVLLTSARGLALLYTDYLWFDEVGFSHTWTGLVLAKAVPALVFGAVFFVLALASLVIADRLAPKRRAMGPEDEIVEHYRAYVTPYAGRLRVAIAAFFAFMFGAPASAQWRDWILFRNSVDFGVSDPQFHRDIGFYVFRLPFLEFIVGWAFAALLGILLLTMVFHYVNGGIRLRSPFQLVTPQVKAHLSVILALMAIVKTAQYWLARFDLNFSKRGVVHGASYTDVKAQLPALNFLMVISVAAALLFIGNIFRRGWVLPVIAVGLWGFVSIVVGGIYPAFLQRVRVEPNELAKEQKYIERNIEATRAAWGIDDNKVSVQKLDYAEDLAAADLNDYRGTLDNVRLWDPPRLKESYQNLQALKAFFQFEDLDVDRYTLGGESVPALIGIRELNGSGLPSPSWVNRHLFYTHGYGAVIAASNAVASGNAPDFLTSGIPPTGEVTIERPETYFGENLSGFAIVGGKPDEYQPVDEEGNPADGTTRYSGSGGVRVSSFLRKAALALRFGSWDLMVSGQLTDQSRTLYVRDVRDRVAKAAPFLRFDADPYPVVNDGRILWVVDGYTTSSQYPYSQRLNPKDLPPGSGLDIEMNYVRNSVKAVVDAYDGSVKLYVVDEDDPVLRAYRKAFPELFTDASEIPAGLREHFRYPEDMFRAQTEQYQKYHVVDATVFYKGSAQWTISPRPGEKAAVGGDSSVTTTTVAGESESKSSSDELITPLYVEMQLPGEDAPEFVITRSFVPFSRDHSKDNQLAGFVIARSDPGETYGRLIDYRTAESSDVPSPLKAANQIDATEEIAREFTLLDAAGSAVFRGNVQLLPVGKTILYVRPIYVKGGSGRGAYPRIKFVAVTYGERSVLAGSVDEALQELFGEGAGRTGGAGTGGTGGTGGAGTGGAGTGGAGTGGTGGTGTGGAGTVAGLLGDAEAEFAAAEESLGSGDWAGYGEHITEAERLVAGARRLLSGEGSTGDGGAESPAATTTSAG